MSFNIYLCNLCSDMFTGVRYPRYGLQMMISFQKVRHKNKLQCLGSISFNADLGPDQHWKKIHFFQIYLFFKLSRIVKLVFFFFFLAKLDELFRDQDIFIISIFQQLRPLDPDPWICTFCWFGSASRKTKLADPTIRILSTEIN